MKIYLISIAGALLISTEVYFFFLKKRDNINDYKGMIVRKQYCGFDNLDGGYYILKDPKTKKLIQVNVDIQFCNVYLPNDTIK